MTAPLDNASDLTNPLINPPALPYGVPPLDLVKPEHFLPAMTHALAIARKKVEAIKNSAAAPTFENTVEALEFATAGPNRVSAVFSHFANAAADDEIRALENPIYAEENRFEDDVMMDSTIFARVKAVYDARETLNLTGEQQMLLKGTYKAFVRKGALLDDASKERMREINERLSELFTAFSANTVKATAAYQKVIDNESDLVGVPERAKKSYKQAAVKAGMPDKWVIKLSPPPTDIAEYCENRALREEISRARANIALGGEFDNRPLILEIMKLRHEEAQLMGFKNYAAFALDDRMAGTPETVDAFLAKNLGGYKPASDAFREEIKAFAKQTDGLDDFKPWDLAIYWRKLQEKTFNIDNEQIRPYFDLEKVLEGVRIHAEKLFNISMTETTGKYPVNNPDVKVYEVKDKKTGEMIGVFYADYYARPGAKSNGAWMSTFRNRSTEDGENKFSFVINVCNFDKPTPDQPTLLALSDVTTVFHEFGHGLHALLAQGNYASQTCTRVKRDFVELPSQLQENWVKEKEVLDTFARHYQTGESLPAELIAKIQEMDNFGAGYMGHRQTFLGMLDMAWHSTDPSAITSVEALEDAIIAKAGLPAREYGGLTSTSFSHIFSGGYAAGYYGYKWAEVLDADVFSVFKQKGLYNQESAERLRETIYSKGGTVDPMELFKQMMGRDPDPNALFRREGLLKPGKPDSNKPNSPKL